jgi:hypothetical protein
MYFSHTVKILEIEEIELRSENMIKVKYVSIILRNQAPVLNLRNEKFKTIEANEIIKLYKEMKERAIGASSDTKIGEGQRIQIAQSNLKQMLEDLF